MKLEKLNAIVTGGASGLGGAVVQALVKAGLQVSALDLPGKEREEAVKAMGAAFIGVDVTDRQQIKQALSNLVESWGSLHVAVNCAGVAMAIKTLQGGQASDLNIFEKVIQVNLSGTYNVCQCAAEVMAKNEPNENGERGLLVMTSSIAAFEGQKGQTAYAASKGGIRSLVLPMARDLADLGIRVMGIAPGVFDTPMMASLPDAAKEMLIKTLPFPKRLGKPEEFAAMIKHMIENPMLNGSVVRLDGALRLN
ncbi:MAG: SDR family NAD(P)-dependent oxidoreductase [Deltaproteobacteria bacterium]|nr:SDR family NAD(P)-dependent oxidoreductase [Deltaproteobacteria bacterium]